MGRRAAVEITPELETRIVADIANGLGYREIARRLGLKSHMPVKRFHESPAFILKADSLRDIGVPLGPNAPPPPTPEERVARGKPRAIEAADPKGRTLPPPPDAIDSDQAFDDPILDANDMRKRLSTAIRPWIRAGMLTPAVVAAVNAALNLMRFEWEVSAARGPKSNRPELEAENERLQAILLGAATLRKTSDGKDE